VKLLPNIKSAKKRVTIAAQNHDANTTKRSKLKTSLKKVTASITAKDLTAARSDLQSAIRIIDESATKGIIHKNQAARRKSRLTKRLNAIT
jgi:small subunit ribosomal protein S20